MSKLIDLTGQRFGRLTVVCRGKTKSRKQNGTLVYWLCKCDCGNEIEISGADIRRGKSQSCGCYQSEMSRQANTTHGESDSKLYNRWERIKQRCLNPNYKEFYLYGGRGITICEEWKNDFACFQRWCFNNGYSPDLEIDRIDSDGGYSPDNCRFATPLQNSNNKRNNKRIEHNGETHTIAEWDRIKGYPPKTVGRRLRRGWSVEEAIDTPLKVKI